MTSVRQRTRMSDAMDRTRRTDLSRIDQTKEERFNFHSINQIELDWIGLDYIIRCRPHCVHVVSSTTGAVWERLDVAHLCLDHSSREAVERFPHPNQGSVGKNQSWDPFTFAFFPPEPPETLGPVLGF